jgi:methyl-accepting chemotaxis protein
MKNLSIRAKLLGAILAVAAANGLFAVFFFPAQQRRSVEASFAREVEALASTVALGIGIGMETGDLTGVQKSMEFARSNPAVRFVYLMSDGEKMASFPEDIRLDNELMNADTLEIGEAEIESDALDGVVYIGASTGDLEAALSKARTVALGVAALLLAFGGVLAFALAGFIVGPIRNAVEQINALAEGRLDSWPENDSEDEVGQMSRALNRAILGIRGALEATEVDWDEITEQRHREIEMRKAEAARIEREREETRAIQETVDRILASVRVASQGNLTEQVEVSGDGAVDQVGRGLNSLLGDLRESIARVAGNVSTLTATAGDLTSVTSRIGDEASSTWSRAREASQAAELVSGNINSAAAATEELTASVSEIAQNAAHAADVARSAVETARATNRSVEALGTSSVEIGSVVEVIATIADKTNLLALNATIEAARAGDAGKGFAVVAHEVKELASQSAIAAQEIGDKINAIQADSESAVHALREITEVISDIDSIQGSIAAAVEEQTATTQEIGRTLDEVAGATEQITATIQTVADAAQSTSDGVSSAQSSVAQLDDMSTGLHALVGQFQYE